MRATSRGDVPEPHLPPNAGKATVGPSEDVVFDAGSLSFVSDWVGGADGTEPPPEIEREPEDKRQSNPNRRLGVGAQPKKAKQARVRLAAIITAVGLGILVTGPFSQCTWNDVFSVQVLSDPNQLSQLLVSPVYSSGCRWSRAGVSWLGYRLGATIRLRYS